MDNDIQEILITEEQIKARIAQLGQELTEEYRGKNPVIVGVLKGVVVFYADMVRQIKVPCQMDFMWLSSYSGANSTGKMLVRQDVTADIEGRHVLILEDIFDTGNSLEFTVNHLFHVGEVAHHAVGVKLSVFAIYGNYPVVSVQIGAFAGVG